MSNLKPCPFCGKEDVDSGGVMSERGGINRLQTICRDCLAVGPEVTGRSSARADAAWNRRPSLPASRIEDETRRLTPIQPEPDVSEVRDVPLLTPTIHNEDLFATHNMPCAVCHARHAVMNCQTEVFQPCWECQAKGYKLAKMRTPGWFRSFLRLIADQSGGGT